MRTLKDELIKKGYPGIHYKTDSVKIPNATNDIIRFVMAFGKLYGYEFEHEATYDRMCLVNDAVYIAKYKDPEKCKDIYGYIPGDNKKKYSEHGGWTATGTQFQVPYTFKQLFSNEPIVFEDLCETKSVSKGSLYLDMNEGLPDVTKEEKELAKLMREINTQMSATYDIWTLPKLTEEDYKNTCPILWKEKEDLEKKIAEGHNYVFVGRVGQFCPVKEGTGGGILLREQDGKYYAATGTKGYRWKESEVVKKLGIEDQIDKSYYNKLADEAIAAINEYGDFYEFVNDTELDLYSDELPF